MKQEDFFTRYSVKLAFGLVVIGVVVIVLFICITPFNDWSGEADPTLFAQYGDFIGGFIGTFFSLAGFFLLYKTLLAQQETLINQEKEARAQKEALEKERFETTFFNLLNVQQNITDKIRANIYTINKSGEVCSIAVSGRVFFDYARSELFKINEIIFSSEYLGIYDESYIGDFKNKISELGMNQSNNDDSVDVEQEKNDIIRNTMIQYANKFYQTCKKWENIKDKEKSIKIKYVYYFFFNKFHYAFEHYFRNQYHILKFIEKYEIDKINNTPNRADHQAIIEDCNKYAQYIQAQMSSYELTLMYYNALCFPKALRLIKKYNLLDNLAVEDLISPNHYDENQLKLKSRPERFEF